MKNDIDIGEMVNMETDETRTPEQIDLATSNEGDSQRIQAMITGRLEPPNTYAAFIVERIRDIRIERDGIQNEIRKGKQLLELMKRKAISLEATHDQYIDDLKEWDKEVVEGRE